MKPAPYPVRGSARPVPLLLGLVGLLGLLGLLGAGCHGSGGDDGGGGTPQPTAFDAFVIGLIQDQTSDETDPVEINDLSFTFDEDETAFDALFDG